MNKYLNKRYEDDLTEIERMSMHQPAVFDSTYVSKKVRFSNKKSNKIKTTREEARFFGEEPSQRKPRTKRAQQEHDLQRDMARPVQRKDPKYKSAAEIGIDKAKQKRAQPGKSWINEVCSPPTKKIKMIVAENELPTQSSSKTTKIREDSSKKPPLKSKKLNKSRPRSKSRNDARPSKSDKKSPPSPGDKNAEKLKEHVTESQKSNSDSKKKRSKIEEYRKLLAELNAEPEHVRKTAPVTVEPPSVSSRTITELPVQQNSVLDDLGFSSSQESEVESVTGLPKDLSRERQACELCKMVLDKSKYCSSCSSGSETEMEPEHEPEHEPEQEPEQEPEAIVRMEIQDEQPSEIIEIDDEDDTIPPCPALVDNDGEDDAADDDDDDDDDVIFVSSSGPIENLPMYHDRSTGQTFCYGQNLDDF